MADGDQPKLHIVMFPWLAFGHIISFLNLSKFIAQKGHKVSFISTTQIIERLSKFNLSPDLSSQINFVKLKLPRTEGLPENAGGTMDVAPHEIPHLIEAMDSLKPELTRFLKAESPDWIIYDFTTHWLPSIASKLGISRVFFIVVNAWSLGYWSSSTEDMINGSDPRKNPEDWLVPPPWIPFPSKVAVRPHELALMAANARTVNTPSGVPVGFRVGLAIKGSDAMFIRHCMEFEPEWIPLVEKLHNKPVIPVGLIPPAVQQDSRDDVDNDETWKGIKEWLDMQNKGSVVYVAMGSEVPLSHDQLTELALGLELSGFPFFWALRKSDSVRLPDDYIERNKGSGMVWTTWAPQLKILSHDSVGGFVTHCGWSSLIEGMMFGKPLIMLPLVFGDQVLSARVLADRKMGIEVPRNEVDGTFTRNSVADSLSLVIVGDEGKIFKEKVKEISAINGDWKLHNKYIDNVINYLETQRGTVAKII